MVLRLFIYIYYRGGERQLAAFEARGQRNVEDRVQLLGGGTSPSHCALSVSKRGRPPYPQCNIYISTPEKNTFAPTDAGGRYNNLIIPKPHSNMAYYL